MLLLGLAISLVLIVAVPDSEAFDGAVGVLATSDTVEEGRTAHFAVWVKGHGEVVVGYRVSGTATSGEDYTEPTGILTIPAGRSSGSIDITTLTDGIMDNGETLTVTLDWIEYLPARGNWGGGRFSVGSRNRATTVIHSLCAAPAGDRRVEVIDAFPNLSFFRPVFLMQAPEDDSRWYVGQKGSSESSEIDTTFVYVFDNDPTVSNKRVFIDLSDRVDFRGEGGLLGMAFHPDFPENGEVFISYTEDGAYAGTGAELVYVLSRFTSPDGGSTLDPDSEQVVLRVNRETVSHIGGGIGFGPNGYLYIGLGDGSNGLDSPHNRAQDTTSMSGAMLRIDVDGGAPYTIPPDNPFADNPLCAADHSSERPCPEIWAWGFRNPWRWSFDRLTGDLWLGDVGQDNHEEVNVVRRGMNYGWNCREGVVPQLRTPAPSCKTAAVLVDPISHYSHREGLSITGGYVYRGSAIPALAGRYLLADWRIPTLWALTDDGRGGFTREELIDNMLVGGRSVNVVSFAQDGDNEVYALDYAWGGSWWHPSTWGRVLKLIDGGDRSPVPDLLSETGCVSRSTPGQPAAGLIPYSVRASFWSDGAVKERWMSIPDGAAITMRERPQASPDLAPVPPAKPSAAADDSSGVDAHPGDFDFPNGTVLMKHFRLDGRLIETRLLMRHLDGRWGGYTYEWNDEGTDASLVRGRKEKRVSGRDWIFPSRSQCMQCHTQVAGFSLGPKVSQLNSGLTYPTLRTENQLAALQALGLFKSPLADPGNHPALPDPTDPAESLDARARSYLDVNCSSCHRPGHISLVSLDLRYETPIDETGMLAVPTFSFGIEDARIVAPGEPNRSTLLIRMARNWNDHTAAWNHLKLVSTWTFAMPPLASNVVDEDGVALVRKWIESLEAAGLE